MWHVRIRTPEQALELVRLFTSLKACQMIPGPQWVEVNPSDGGDHWLAPDRATFDAVCPRASASEIVGPAVPMKRFRVTRCLVGVGQDDGNLYSVDEYVMENGETETERKKMVLPNARARIGSCDPAAPPQ
jgi:hypothetical protein